MFCLRFERRSDMLAKIPATSANLGPGFDTLGLALKLYNKSVVKPSKFFSISIRGEGRDNVKLKNNNMFVNIFYQHYQKFTDRRDTFRFTFYNDIPLSRGLGSSSATILSAISLAYEAAGQPFDKAKILNDALKYEHHPDNITPAMYGGFTTSIVKQKVVYQSKVIIPDDVKAVVVIPNQSMSTAYSRTRLPKHYHKDVTTFNVGHSSLVTAAFCTQDWELLRVASEDMMHQSYRMNALRELYRVQRVALEQGALMSTLSGSGSTFFNMTYADDANSLHERLAKEFPKYRIKTLSFDNEGLVLKN